MNNLHQTLVLMISATQFNLLFSGAQSETVTKVLREHISALKYCLIENYKQ